MMRTESELATPVQKHGSSNCRLVRYVFSDENNEKRISGWLRMRLVVHDPAV